MRRLNQSIVEIEESDTLEGITNWVLEHQTSYSLVDTESWLVKIKPGDVIIFNSAHGMYRLFMDIEPVPEATIFSDLLARRVAMLDNSSKRKKQKRRTKKT